MSTSIFCVETTCNVLELGHYVIRNLWIVFSHVTTFLSGALLVHITYIKTTKTTTVQRGDNEGFYGRFLAVGRPVSVLRNFMTRIHQALSKQGEDVMKLSEKTFNKLIAAISTD